jgi:diaminopimelate epimerase
VPVEWDGPHALQAKIEVDGQMYEASCISVGNPHAILFVDDPSAAPVTTLGPRIENHRLFPNGTNVEFVRIDAPDRVTMRVWERGSGETLACGTGAVAVAVVGRLVGGMDARSTVVLPGGELEVEWAGSLEQEAPIFMTGPAVRSFDGVVDLDEVTN